MCSKFDEIIVYNDSRQLERETRRIQGSSQQLIKIVQIIFSTLGREKNEVPWKTKIDDRTQKGEEQRETKNHEDDLVEKDVEKLMLLVVEKIHK